MQKATLLGTARLQEEYWLFELWEKALFRPFVICFCLISIEVLPSIMYNLRIFNNNIVKKKNEYNTHENNNKKVVNLHLLIIIIKIMINNNNNNDK